MTRTEKKIEKEALKEFIGLVDCGGNMAARVNTIVREELTPRQAELIHMYYAEQKSMTEIAEILSINPSTVSRTLQRGRCRIKKYLKYNGRAFAYALSE